MYKYNQYGKGYYPDLNINVAGIAGIGSYDKNNPPIFIGELTRDIQFGGYQKYNYITNPLTNRKCKIDSALGKKILKKYYNKSKDI
tara:strand:+ start:9917 stop:10174 length:258 start_codon:yes stop_codon:yes gene_type:complete